MRTLVELDEDVVCDLRINNGRPPKFEDFWLIVDDVKEKTTVDRRHTTLVNDGEDVLVNIAISNSYADLYRQCVRISERKGVDILSEQWFLLQFWPCSRTTSKMAQYTGRFKVRNMVQSRILRKNNPDAHYTNAIQRFIMKRAVKYRDTCIYVSADANTKVQVGEPGFPIASVARGRQVIVGEK